MGRQKYYKHRGRYLPPSKLKAMGLKIGKKKPHYKRKGRYVTGRELRRRTR